MSVFSVRSFSSVSLLFSFFSLCTPIATNSLFCYVLLGSVVSARKGIVRKGSQVLSPELITSQAAFPPRSTASIRSRDNAMWVYVVAVVAVVHFIISPSVWHSAGQTHHSPHWRAGHGPHLRSLVGRSGQGSVSTRQNRRGLSPMPSTVTGWSCV